MPEEEVMEEKAPASNIKQFIVDSRKDGHPDSTILNSLKSVNWPDDVIEAAIKEANQEVPANPEPEEQPKEEKKEEPKPEEPKEEKVEEKTETADKKPEQKDEKKQEPESPILKEGEQQPKKDSSGFSVGAIIALLLSPIPFVGFYLGLAAVENCRKNKQSGMYFALLAIALNIVVILYILYMMYQIFTLDTDQLTGISKIIVDQLGIL